LLVRYTALDHSVERAVERAGKTKEAVHLKHCKEDGGREKRTGAGRHGPLWHVAVQLGLTVLGFALLVVGSRWMVAGSVTIAKGFGISELMIGLTILAVGTSLPEIVTSILATVRGHSEIAVGNVVGSNIFNVLAVLGLSSIVAPEGIEVSRAALHLDIPVMIAVAVACLPIFFTQYRIDRWEGYLFLGYYVAYTVYLIVHATHPERERTLVIVLLGVVVPLTAITLLIGVIRAWPEQMGRVPIFAWLGSTDPSHAAAAKRARHAARREKRKRREIKKDRKRQRRKKWG
jgi:hypothetical protein